MKILLVRLRQIGDVILTTPAIRALRDRFPDSRLTYVVEPAAAPIVKNHPLLDEVVVVPFSKWPGGLAGDVGVGLRLRQRRFDLAIDFHGGPRAALLTWLSRAPQRIGYEISGRAWMYTHHIPRPPKLRPRHSVENQWDLLLPLGVPPPSSARYPLEMTVDHEAVAAVSDRLADTGTTSADALIVMHVSAGGRFRRWPLDFFAEVAATLALRAALNRIVVTSGPSESDAAALVICAARARLPPTDQHRVLSCGEFSLAELRALVERAALFIGGDSGPMHIAAASRVPIVTLYGPTLPARSRPWRDAEWLSAPVEVAGLECRPCAQRVCAPGDFRCLTWMRPQQVVDAADRLLAKNR